MKIKELDAIIENVVTAAKRGRSIARMAPKSREAAWIGGVGPRQHGTRTSVTLKFDPRKINIRNRYIYHTHPESTNIFAALPSQQDLESARRLVQFGLSGSVIYSGNNYAVISPRKHEISREPTTQDYKKYYKAIQDGDMNKITKVLNKIGFDVETGED